MSGSPIIKRKLPPATGKYASDDANVIAIMRDTKEWKVWALFKSMPILLVRSKTHDITGSKWVEFNVVPEFQLVPQGLIYADPHFATRSVRCDWSDFLRLTRWKKALQDLPPAEQALIARVDLARSTDHPFYLVAVDHPIRNRGKED